DPTVIGDSVNLASRLEGLTRIYGVDILVGASAAELTRDEVHLRSVARVQVKGKSKPVDVFTFIGGRNEEVDPEFLKWLETYEEGLELFRARDFTEAKILFFHFLGICGTAMASVAAALKERGFKVTGSDENAYPPMSTFLQEKDISLREGYCAENIPADADVVVIGNAMKRGNPEVEAVLNRKLLYLSLPEVLKNYFLRGRHNLVVTGTHGKTTTTALLTWIMEKAGLKPGYLIGGLPKNFGQGARLNDSKYFVIEGDEYDTAFFDKRSKFVHYLPELVIVNNIEFDHADIFKNLDEIKLSFRRLLNIVPQNGMVLLNGDDPNCVEVAKDCLA